MSNLETHMAEQDAITAQHEAEADRLEDRRAVATILAALRFWQREGLHSGGHEHDIATDNETLIPMNAAEIDALCERINTEA